LKTPVGKDHDTTSIRGILATGRTQVVGQDKDATCGRANRLRRKGFSQVVTCGAGRGATCGENVDDRPIPVKRANADSVPPKLHARRRSFGRAKLRPRLEDDASERSSGYL
jgi:hypothetical protein